MLRAVGFPDDYLHPQEELLLNLTPHWFRLVPAGASLVGSLVLGILAMTVWDVSALRILSGVLILVTLGWFVSSYISWVSTHFVLTTDRVIHREGVFRRSGIEIPLERINTVFSSQSMFERMIGAGDLAVESASEDGRQNFEDMRNPGKIQNEIYIAMENNENRKYDRISDATRQNAPAATAPAAPSVTDQLHQLDDLRQRGVITQEEFDRKKADLLDRM
jgi:uncharacterized membrane protein YdbT with pleckstrin-like domain